MIDVAGIIGGFITLSQPTIIVSTLIGFAIGIFFGMMPGLTATLAIALLLPFTYAMDIIPALVMTMGIFMAGMYAGSITATTINIPGAPGAMMTGLEGYPMMQRGEGAKALRVGASASLVGGTVSVLMLMVIAPLIAQVALNIRTPDKFSLLLLALVLVSIIQRRAAVKGIIATIIGLMFATVGMDMLEPIARLHFGTEELTAGLDLIPVIIGVFAISEILMQAEMGGGELEKAKKELGKKFRRRDFIPRLRELKELGVKTLVKGTLIGHLIGALPGAGASVATFLSYAEAQRASKHPERYGKGTPEGIAATETANNAICGGALIPTLTFGIPGDATTALVLGVFLIQGIVPGPKLLKEEFYLIAPMYAALFVCALLIPIALIIFGPYYLRLVRVNRAALYSLIAVIAMVGAYVATFSSFQMGLALFTGVIAYFFRKQGYPTVPILLGYILGPMTEVFLRRSLMLSGGSPLIFFTSLPSIMFLVLIIIFVYFITVRPWLRSRVGRKLREKSEDSELLK